jgi:hypothetical protein
MGVAFRRRIARSPRAASSLLLVLVASTLLLAGCGGGSPSDPSSPVSVTGTSNGWVFHDGQTVTVSMGPNTVFKPNSHVNIVQCADPGGTKANLPTQFIQCDENTIQADTVVVEPGGSFKEKTFSIYALPSGTLGEFKDGMPVCNQTHQCVLLVSEYQTDLSKPHVFSHAFTVVPSNGSGSGS